jgi:prepilin-type N-terminal cleavage/methylation domain-containing protein
MSIHYKIRPIISAGFTLIEVALALLVVAIGMIAVMGLFPQGLEANKRSIDETRVAMFAEDVMSGYRALSRVTAWNNLPSRQLPAVAVDMWKKDSNASSEYYLDIVPNDQNIRTNVYALDPTFSWVVSEEIFIDYALRYRLTVETGNRSVATLRLEVWPGQFGSEDNPTVFLTELYYTGIDSWPPAL